MANALSDFAGAGHESVYQTVSLKDLGQLANEAQLVRSLPALPPPPPSTARPSERGKIPARSVSTPFSGQPTETEYMSIEEVFGEAHYRSERAQRGGRTTEYESDSTASQRGGADTKEGIYEELDGKSSGGRRRRTSLAESKHALDILFSSISEGAAESESDRGDAGGATVIHEGEYNIAGDLHSSSSHSSSRSSRAGGGMARRQPGALSRRKSWSTVDLHEINEIKFGQWSSDEDEDEKDEEDESLDVTSKGNGDSNAGAASETAPSVSVSNEPPTPQHKPPTSQHGVMHKAAFSYSARKWDELSFEQGIILHGQLYFFSSFFFFFLLLFSSSSSFLFSWNLGRCQATSFMLTCTIHDVMH